MVIKKYTNTRGTFYEASTYINIDGVEKRPHKRGFRTKIEAQRWIDNIRVNQDYIPRSDVTYQDVFEEWFESYRLTVQPSTYFKTKEAFDNHILPAVGKRKIDCIHRAKCQKLANQWAEQFVDSRKFFSRFSRVLAFAVKVGYIKKNPCKQVVIPKSQVKSTPKKEYLTPDETNTFLKACKDYSNQ